jgi:hypothetical protein
MKSSAHRLSFPRPPGVTAAALLAVVSALGVACGPDKGGTEFIEPRGTDPPLEDAGPRGARGANEKPPSSGSSSASSGSTSPPGNGLGSSGEGGMSSAASGDAGIGRTEAGALETGNDMGGGSCTEEGEACSTARDCCRGTCSNGICGTRQESNDQDDPCEGARPCRGAPDSMDEGP